MPKIVTLKMEWGSERCAWYQSSKEILIEVALQLTPLDLETQLQEPEWGKGKQCRSWEVAPTVRSTDFHCDTWHPVVSFVCLWGCLCWWSGLLMDKGYDLFLYVPTLLRVPLIPAFRNWSLDLGSHTIKWPELLTNREKKERTLLVQNWRHHSTWVIIYLIIGPHRGLLLFICIFI